MAKKKRERIKAETCRVTMQNAKMSNAMAAEPVVESVVILIQERCLAAANDGFPFCEIKTLESLISDSTNNAALRRMDNLNKLGSAVISELREDGYEVEIKPAKTTGMALLIKFEEPE